MSCVSSIRFATKLGHLNEILVIHVVGDVAPVNLKWLETFDELDCSFVFLVQTNTHHLVMTFDELVLDPLLQNREIGFVNLDDVGHEVIALLRLFGLIYDEVVRCDSIKQVISHVYVRT